MSAFRKRPKGFRFVLGDPPIIREVVTETITQNGNKVNKESVVLRSETEYLSEHPIVMETYSIKEQIEAGVSLKEIPTSTMYDSNDNLDYPENEVAEQKILDVLNNDNVNNNE